MAGNFDGLAPAQVSMTVHDLGRPRRSTGTCWDEALFLGAAEDGFFDWRGRALPGDPREAEFDHPGSVALLRVADIEPARGARRTGVVFEEEPHLIARTAPADLWMAAFRDSEGNCSRCRARYRDSSAAGARAPPPAGTLGARKQREAGASQPALALSGAQGRVR